MSKVCSDRVVPGCTGSRWCFCRAGFACLAVNPTHTSKKDQLRCFAPYRGGPHKLSQMLYIYIYIDVCTTPKT